MSDPGHHHQHGGCSHDHDHNNNPEHKILNEDNLEVPAEADIDLDAMHPEVQIPTQQYPLTEDELRNDYVMLTEDGGIKKKTITASKEPDLGTPPKNSNVTCHYTGTLPNNNDEKFDSSRDRNDPFTFKIGEGKVIKGWDIGIASMKKGERCILRCASPYAYGDSGSPPKIPGKATLDFDVELIDWDSWNDCSGAEGQISKKILIESDGTYDDEVSDDALCVISYRIYWIQSGSNEILSSRDKISILVDDDDRFTSGFHIALKSMKVGEKAVFKIKDKSLSNTCNVYVSPEELKNNELNHNKRNGGENEIVFYEINLHSMNKGKEKWNAKNEERIDEANKYKNNGNDLFKMGRFDGAINKYKKALDWIDIDFSDDGLKLKKDELIIKSNNNLSLIYIKKKDWSSAILHANQVLEKDRNNLKGLMRRGQSRLQAGFLDLSKEDLKKAQSLDKNNTYIKKLLKVCTKRHKDYLQKQQKLYSGMFGNKKEKKKKKESKKDDKQEESTVKEMNEQQEKQKARDEEKERSGWEKAKETAKEKAKEAAREKAREKAKEKAKEKYHQNPIMKVDHSKAVSI